MFGLLRMALALLVMCQHLLNLVPLGQYAVFCFYVVSGYLMTLVMHETYGYSLKGRYFFVLNRFLRLYPQYWIVVGLTLLLILLLGQDLTRNYNASLYLPYLPMDWVQNILMVFPAWSPIHIFPRLVPPAWAITVELFFYALICLGISKTLQRTRLWFLASLVYVLITYLLGLDDSERYFPLMAGSLPFSIGAGIWFYIKNVSATRLARLSPLLLFAVLLVNCLWGLWLFRNAMPLLLQELAFYANLLIGSLLVYRIACGGQILALGRKFDQWIGDYSYPVYLSHWQAGLLSSVLLFGRPIHEYSRRGIESFLGAAVIVLLLGTVLILLVDRPLQGIRQRFKKAG